MEPEKKCYKATDTQALYVGLTKDYAKLVGAKEIPYCEFKWLRDEGGWRLW